jgi:hypothetical protein
VLAAVVTAASLVAAVLFWLLDRHRGPGVATHSERIE